MVEDDPLFHMVSDSHDLHELLDKLIDLGIIDKDTLMREYWYDIEENISEFLPISQE